ncbi:MAG TPA: hypothetical protein VI980_08010 [Acidimicrobiia bacterium]|nr:hypothetical protein [Acidimicrobiia bacterium]
MKVIVQRSGIRMWLMAMGAIPLLVISIDVLTNRRITNWLRERLFAPADTQIFEPRDVIYAWAILLFAAFLVIWGLKELFLPTRVVECRDEGLALKLRGPFRPHDLIPWAKVVDVDAGEIEDDGEVLPLLRVRVLERGVLPVHPWGARWLDARSLGVLAQDWALTPGEAATLIGEFAVDVARRAELSKLGPLGDAS